MIALASCSVSTNAGLSSSPKLTFELFNSTESEANTALDVSQCTFTPAGMPTPFAHEGGDDNHDFYFPYVQRLELIDPMTQDFARYLGITEYEFIDSFADKFYKRYWAAPSDWKYLSNIFSVMIKYDIPNEVVAASLRNHNEAQEYFAAWSESQGWYGNAELFRSRKFSEAEIEAILSRDATLVLQQFATEYAIVIENQAFAPVWLYLNTVEDYQRVGITIEMVEDRLKLFNNLNLTDEAAMAFGEKLSEFTGRSVTIESISEVRDE